MEVLIVAYFLQMIGEQGRKRFAIGDGIVLASFLPGAQGLFHFLCSVREDIKLVEVRYGSVNHVRPRSSIDLNVHIGRCHTWRDPAQAEAHDLGRISVLNFALPQRVRWACFFFDTEFNMQPVVLVDAQ
jgi:hypothetical protein